MKTRKLRKFLMLLASALLLVSVTVGATVAYLTATTDVVTNTFSVGNVALTLDEADVNLYGEYEYVLDDEGEPTATKMPRVTANEYKLIPGHTYIKDPTVHITTGSENGWLFVKVDNGIAAIEDATTIANQMATLGWSPVDATKYPGVYAYKEIVKAGEDHTVFKNFKLVGDADVADYANAQITVRAYMVQADGFETAAAAYEAAPCNWNAAQ